MVRDDKVMIEEDIVSKRVVESQTRMITSITRKGGTVYLSFFSKWGGFLGAFEITEEDLYRLLVADRVD
jgi:hypothetical protein